MSDMQRLKIAAYAPSSSACGYYRILIPLSYLSRYKLADKVRIFGSLSGSENIDDYDVVITQRETRPTIREDLRKLRLLKKTIILDTDDMLECVHPSNPAYQFYYPGSPHLENYLWALKNSDALTVTTHELRKNYEHTTDSIFVLPNYLDFEMREWPRMHGVNQDRLRIGWSGSSSHLKDLTIIGPVLKSILSKYRNVVYVHFAHEDLFKFLLKQYSLPEDRAIIIPPVDFEKYPQQLANFDIGLCPLANSEFNRCKSDLKPKEYGACGIPFVASNVAPYARYAEEGKDGFLATSEVDWIERISQLIEDAKLRTRMAYYAFQKVRSNYGMLSHINEYLECWSDIRNGKKKVWPRVGRNDDCPCGSGAKAKRCKCYPIYS